MNVIQGRQTACEKTRELLDAYIDNELLAETNQQVMQHTESCPGCLEMLESRLQAKRLVRRAARTVEAPPELRMRIQRQLREQHTGRSWFGFPLPVPALAAVAAMLVLGVGLFTLPSTREYMAERAFNLFGGNPPQAVLALLQIGAGDHVHCALGGTYPTKGPSLQEFSSKLDAEMFSVVSVVNLHTPEDYSLVEAHRCTFGGRKFVHVVLRNQHRYMSVVITRKQGGDSFLLAKVLPQLTRGGVPVYAASTSEVSVAGFESSDYLAFVASDLPSKENMYVAASMAPQLHEILNQWKG